MTSIQYLFATPVAVMNLVDSEQLNSVLEQDSLALKALGPGRVRSNVMGWHSENDLFNRPESSFKKLASGIVEAARAYITAQIPEINGAVLSFSGNGWINVSGRGGMNVPHTHVGSHVSGVYYVTNPEGEHERSGYIEFLDPRNDIAESIFKKVPSATSQFRLKADPGSLIFFPSYLKHWVYPNLSDEDRITIAFNLKVEESGK